MTRQNKIRSTRARIQRIERAVVDDTLPVYVGCLVATRLRYVYHYGQDGFALRSLGCTAVVLASHGSLDRKEMRKAAPLIHLLGACKMRIFAVSLEAPSGHHKVIRDSDGSSTKLRQHGPVCEAPLTTWK